jgi:hypothetical protein
MYIAEIYMRTGYQGPLKFKGQGPVTDTKKYDCESTVSTMTPF